MMNINYRKPSRQQEYLIPSYTVGKLKDKCDEKFGVNTGISFKLSFDRDANKWPPRMKTKCLITLWLHQPIGMGVHWIKDGRHRYSLDMKHRTNTILDYLNDKFQLPKGSFVILENPETGELENVDISGNFSDLPAELKSHFKNAPLYVIELRGYTEQEAKDYYARVNNGVSIDKTTITWNSMPEFLTNSMDKIWPDIENQAKEVFHESKENFKKQICSLLYCVATQKFGEYSQLEATDLANIIDNIKEEDIDKIEKRVKKNMNFLHDTLRINAYIDNELRCHISSETGKPIKKKRLTMLTAKCFMQIANDLSYNILAAKNKEERIAKITYGYMNTKDSRKKEMTGARVIAYTKDILSLICDEILTKDGHRFYTDEETNEIASRQNYLCAISGKPLPIKTIPTKNGIKELTDRNGNKIIDRTLCDTDHRKRHSDGGKTTIEQGQVVLKEYHIKKTAEENRTKLVAV